MLSIIISTDLFYLHGFPYSIVEVIPSREMGENVVDLTQLQIVAMFFAKICQSGLSCLKYG